MNRRQKWLSYLYDIEVETVESQINGPLTLLISKGEYQLCTEEAIYSFGQKYYNFSALFRQIDLPKDGSEVLILGFGLGSIPLLLEQYHQKKYNYTAVEIDEEIIRLASDYVLDDINAPIDIICTDAEIFVEINQEKYDMICVDIFLGSQIPEQFETIDFLEKLKERLSPNGIVIINRLYHYEKDKIASDKYFNEVFKTVFPNSNAIKSHMNLMLVSDHKQ